MKFDKIVNSLLSEATKTKGYSLYWKDEEHKKTSKWYTASTPENLLQQVNRDNLTGDFEYGMVDEDHEFKSFQELLDFCSHSDFFITGPTGEIISGMYMKDEDAEASFPAMKPREKKPISGSSKQIITKAIDDLRFTASSLSRTNLSSANSIFEVIESLQHLLANE